MGCTRRRFFPACLTAFAATLLVGTIGPAFVASATTGPPVRIQIVANIAVISATGAATVQAYPQLSGCRTLANPCPPEDQGEYFAITLIDLTYATPGGLPDDAPGIEILSPEVCWLAEGLGRNFARCIIDQQYAGALFVMSNFNDEVIWFGSMPAEIYGNGGDDRYVSGYHAAFRASGPDGPTKFVGGPGRDTADYSTRCDQPEQSFFGAYWPEQIAPAVRVSNDGVANDGTESEGDNIGTDVEVLIGGDGDDVLTGGSGNDTLIGDVDEEFARCNGTWEANYPEGGRDTLTGGGGDDTLQGGWENDKLTGGPGNDSLSGDDGDDTLRGNDGGDLVVGGAGLDRLYGGGGADSLDADDGTGLEIVACAGGSDQATVDPDDVVSACEGISQP